MQDADFRIDFDGQWFHNNEPIQREALVKLFAQRALTVDESGNYWLSTPHERYPVIVEDVPFLIIDAREDGNGGLVFTTNIGETALLPPGGKPEMRHNARAAMKLPYIHIRDGLHARLSRAVYHDLAAKYGETLFS